MNDANDGESFGQVIWDNPYSQRQLVIGSSCILKVFFFSYFGKVLC